MGKKTPPFINCPSITTSKFWTPIRSDFRKRWMFFPERKKAILNARAGKYQCNNKGVKVFHVMCDECKGLFAEKDKGFDVDHIIDVGGLNCFADLPLYVERLFCKVEDLRVLCKSCHKAKTYK